MARGFWSVVDALLAFVDVPEPLAPRDLPRLVALLDELALSVPGWDGKPPACDDDPPERDAEQRRGALAARFPGLGYYRVVAPAEPDGDDDGEVTLADAIDDLLDISSDLLDARWYREHGDAGDGERCAGEMFRYHWGRHLRDLQSHLHRRLHEQ